MNPKNKLKKDLVNGSRHEKGDVRLVYGTKAIK